MARDELIQKLYYKLHLTAISSTAGSGTPNLSQNRVAVFIESNF